MKVPVEDAISCVVELFVVSVGRVVGFCKRVRLVGCCERGRNLRMRR